MSRKTQNHNPRITILGIGNLLLKDEGVGVHLIRKLARDNTGYANLNIIDGGTSPDIFSLVDDSVDKLIVVDAVKPEAMLSFVEARLAVQPVGTVACKLKLTAAHTALSLLVTDKV